MIGLNLIWGSSKSTSKAFNPVLGLFVNGRPMLTVSRIHACLHKLLLQYAVPVDAQILRVKNFRIKQLATSAQLDQCLGVQTSALLAVM